MSGGLATERGQFLSPSMSYDLERPHFPKETGAEEEPVYAGWLALKPRRRPARSRSAVLVAWPELSSRRVQWRVRELVSLRAVKAVVRRVGDCAPQLEVPEKDKIHTAIRIRQCPERTDRWQEKASPGVVPVPYTRLYQ